MFRHMHIAMPCFYFEKNQHQRSGQKQYNRTGLIIILHSHISETLTVKTVT